MLNFLPIIFASALFASTVSATNAGIGTASATVQLGGVDTNLLKSVALLRDDAEGLMEQKRIIRVLLSDKPESASTLVGVSFPPALGLARQGQLKGMLLEFDPSDRTRMRVTLLAKPDVGGVSLESISLFNSQGLWQSLHVTPDRIEGSYQSSGDGVPSFGFDAPLASDAIVADLKGIEAQKSEPLQVLIARAEAIRDGDLTTAVRLSSADSANTLRFLPTAALTQVAAGMSELIRELRSSNRVVVRKSSAAAILSEGSFASAVLENGSWKAAD
jgi:hypothetical protein